LAAPNTEAEAEQQLTEPEDIAAAIHWTSKGGLWKEIETLSDELEPNGIEKAGTPYRRRQE